MGTRKLPTKLKSTKKGYKPGRDRFFSLLRKNQLLIPLKKCRYACTTQAGWWRCENRLTDFMPDGPDQAYVSDITYLDSAHGFVYLTLITDAFSCYIVGYALSDSLATDASLKALEQALSQRKTPKSGLIHHSDRGVQFTDRRYRELARCAVWVPKAIVMTTRWLSVGDTPIAAI